LARALLEDKVECSLFLYEDSVLAVNKNLVTGSTKHIPTIMENLIEKGLDVFVCGTCASFRGMKRGDLVPGAKLAGIATLAKLMDDCDRFFTLA
jgi:tRNA 2-thiouridine synthesizing protein D